MIGRTAAIGCAWLWAAGCGAAEVAVCVTSPEGRPVEDSAVLVDGGGPPPRSPTRTVSVEQIDRDFVPYLTIIPQGAEIEFPNRDPLKHHVYSFSAAKPFEIKLYAGKPASPILFDKSGDVAIGCNIHDWMEAYILVVETAFFAKTDADGCARVGDLPPGPYRVRLWHPRQKRTAGERAVILESAGSAANLAMTLEAAPRQRRPKQPLDKDGY